MNQFVYETKVKISMNIVMGDEDDGGEH